MTAGKVSKRLIARNILWNWSGRFGDILIGFFIAPFLVHQLGQTTYGLWTVIAALTGYFGVLDLGVRTSVGRYLTFYRTKKDYANVQAVFSTAAVFLCSVGVLAFVGILGVNFFFFHIFKVAPAEVPAARLALLLIGANLAITLPATLFDATLWAFQRFDAINGTDLVAAVVRAGLTFWLLLAGHGLVALAIITIISTLVGAAGKIWLTFREEPTLRFGLGYVSRDAALTLFRYGLWRVVMSLCRLGVTRFNPLLIGGWLGMALVTPYALSVRLVGYAIAVVMATRGVLTPAATALHAEDHPEWQPRFMVEAGRYAATIACFFLVGLSLLGGPFLTLWVGADLAYGGKLLLILIIGEFLPFFQAGTSSMLLGLGRHRAIALLGVVELAVGIPLAFALIGPWGLVGVCLAQACVAAAFRGVGQIVYACWVVGLSVREYLQRSMLPAILGTLPAAGVLWAMVAWRTPASWVELFSFASVFGTMFLATHWFWLRRPRPTITPDQPAGARQRAADELPV